MGSDISATTTETSYNECLEPVLLQVDNSSSVTALNGAITATDTDSSGQLNIHKDTFVYGDTTIDVDRKSRLAFDAINYLCATQTPIESRFVISSAAQSKLDKNGATIEHISSDNSAGSEVLNLNTTRFGNTNLFSFGDATLSSAGDVYCDSTSPIVQVLTGLGPNDIIFNWDSAEGPQSLLLELRDKVPTVTVNTVGDSH